jgi:hypothetical protein
MNITRRHATFIGAAALFAPGVRAQAAWPSKPLRIVAGGAGGVSDIRARWLADRLATALGQPVVVENSGAAGGNVGAEQVARAAPDGYTLLLIHQGTAAVNPHLYAHIGYNALTDFGPITRFGYGPCCRACTPACRQRCANCRTSRRQAGWPELRLTQHAATLAGEPSAHRRHRGHPCRSKAAAR